MKKITKASVYDTETATLVKKVTYSYFGDPKGYEECLFVTEEGKYFLYFRGGSESKYPTESIRACRTAVSLWKKENL